jgi:hypothetical protein
MRTASKRDQNAKEYCGGRRIPCGDGLAVSQKQTPFVCYSCNDICVRSSIFDTVGRSIRMDPPNVCPCLAGLYAGGWRACSKENGSLGAKQIEAVMIQRGEGNWN